MTELAPDGFLLDDGTAIGKIVLTGEAAEYLPLIEPGDALNATGRVEADGTGFRIVVDEAAGLVRVGDPTAASAELAAGAPASATAGRRHDRRAARSPAACLGGGRAREPPGWPASSCSAASRWPSRGFDGTVHDGSWRPAWPPAWPGSRRPDAG